MNQVSIYEVETTRDPDFEHLGCFGGEHNSRMFAKRISYDGWGMTPTKCFEWVQKNGGKEKYPVFGVQMAAECWIGTPAELTALKNQTWRHKQTGTCSHGSRGIKGMGTDWFNDVYEIK